MSDYPLNPVLDSSGSLLPPGSFAGTYTSFGDFDSCLAIDEYPAAISSGPVRGQYCFATLRLPEDSLRVFDSIQSSDLSAEGGPNWKIGTLKRWLEADFRYPIARALCIPSVCRPPFVRQLILE